MKKIVALMALMLAGVTFSYGASNGVSVDVVLDQSEFLPGEDLQVAVRITNVSGQELELGADNQWVTFNVEGDRGNFVPPTGVIPVADKFTLHSSQVATRRVNIAPYFNLNLPGRYHVTATVNIPQWGQQVSSKAAPFMIMTGAQVVDSSELEFGVPPKPGEKPHAPEMRRYSLEKASYVNSLKLYMRLIDANGKTLRVLPIDRMVSFSKPEAQIDEQSNLHELHQTGARSFNYCVISPDGELLLRQTYQYTSTRPTLRKNSEGKVYVGGGIRLLSARDYPPLTASLPKPKTDAQPATP